MPNDELTGPQVALDLDAVAGMELPIVSYEACREKILEYVTAIGDTNPLYQDTAFAREHAHRDIIAPPTFAAVFSTRPMRLALADPSWVRRSTITPSRILHGEQTYDFHRAVTAGDRLVIQTIVDHTYTKGSLNFVVLATRVDDDRGEHVLDATTTLILRPEES